MFALRDLEACWRIGPDESGSSILLHGCRIFKHDFNAVQEAVLSSLKITRSK